MRHSSPSQALPTSAFAILGLLALRPWSTYELAQQMERAIRHFWPRAERMVYADPKLLVSHGLARVERGQTGRRPRHVYSITPKGRRVLAAWLAAPPQRPPQLEFEGMVKVFFGEHGSKEALLQTLRAIEADAAATLAAFGALAREVATQRIDPFPGRIHLRALTFDFHVAHARLIRDWARRATATVSRWRTTAVSARSRAEALALIAQIAADESPPSDGLNRLESENPGRRAPRTRRVD